LDATIKLFSPGTDPDAIPPKRAYFDVFTAYWSLKTVSNTLPFSPRMQINFLTLLDVFFSIEASSSTTALISTSPILEFIFMTPDAVEIQLDVFNRGRALLQGNEAGCSASGNFRRVRIFGGCRLRVCSHGKQNCRNENEECSDFHVTNPIFVMGVTLKCSFGSNTHQTGSPCPGSQGTSHMTAA
jgi:hypothetical protein